jgi:hypothetical protein
LKGGKGRERKIQQDFYATDVMINRNWTKANQELRHVLTGLAVHDYHHKLCRGTY